MTMTLIETKTLGASAASIEFTSIPQDGTDLLLVYSLRDTSVSGSSTANGVDAKINGTTSNFSFRRLLGNGSAVSSATGDFEAGFGITNNSSGTSNTFSSGAIYFPNYSGSTPKSYSLDAVNENNGTSALIAILAGLWNDTSAITSITISPNGGNSFVSGTTASLYKITKGSSGGVVVS
jgi:hypothetical protein